MNYDTIITIAFWLLGISGAVVIIGFSIITYMVTSRYAYYPHICGKFLIGPCEKDCLYCRDWIQEQTQKLGKDT